MALIDWITSNRKAKPERKPNDQPAQQVSNWSTASKPMIAYRDAVNAQQALVHPILFRVLNKIAFSVASVKWYVEEDPYVKSNEKPSRKVAKALEDLLHSPNDVMAENQLRYWMALSFACYGRTPIKVGVGTEGLPNGIYPLNAAAVKTNFDSRGVPKSYTYGSGDNKETLPTRKVMERQKVKSSYAYEISVPALSGSLDANNSTTPLQAAGLPADVISYLLQRAVDTASGHPNVKYIITAEKTLSKTQKQSLIDRITDAETNESEAGNILFLYNTKIDLHTLDNNMADIHSKVPLDDMSRMIAGLFGVPVALMGFGASDSAKYASNYAESRESFWADTIIPMYLDPIATGLTAALCPYGLRVVFDHDSIESLKVARMSTAKLLEKVDFLTTNEKRGLCGFGPTTEIPATPQPPAAPEPGSETDE